MNFDKDETILGVKQSILNKSGNKQKQKQEGGRGVNGAAAVSHLCLKYDNAVLANDRTLSQLGIENSSILRLIRYSPNIPFEINLVDQKDNIVNANNNNNNKSQNKNKNKNENKAKHNNGNGKENRIRLQFDKPILQLREELARQLRTRNNLNENHRLSLTIQLENKVLRDEETICQLGIDSNNVLLLKKKKKKKNYYMI